MYPKWIAKATRLACKDCRYCTSFHDIVGIGMTRPSRKEPYAGPSALITLACPGCGVRIHVTVREPVESVILALGEMARLADEAGRNKPSPFNFSKLKTDAGSEAETKIGDGGGLRPSRRAGQPDTPPTQHEIQAFLRRLRKTSFRRKSKGFSRWMKEFEADAGAGGDAGDES
jgi:hypothetical protein